MNDPNDDAQCVDGLLPGSTGTWRITTATGGSTHVVDLDAGTVTRFPGPASSPTINDCERPLRTLDACRVGEPGRWTMQTDSESVEYYWHVTSVILRIEKIMPSHGEAREAAGNM